jgi:hypothetical protein
MTMTRTVARLRVSKAAFDEISKKLKDAGYDCVMTDGNIDMEGIALESLQACDVYDETVVELAAAHRTLERVKQLRDHWLSLDADDPLIMETFYELAKALTAALEGE